MAKIKIISNEVNMEGHLENGKVMPFGTSSHVIVQKKHIGKKVGIVIPMNPRYTWIFDNKMLDDVVKAFNDHIGNIDTKEVFYYKDALAKVISKDFGIEDLSKVVDILIKNGKCGELVKLIKQKYRI